MKDRENKEQKERVRTPNIFTKHHRQKRKKFLKLPAFTSPTTEYGTNPEIKSFLYDNKRTLDKHLPTIC